MAPVFSALAIAVAAAAALPAAGAVAIVKVGGPLQLTGTHASIGEGAKHAFEMWQAWVADNPSLGYTIELSFVDAPDADTAVSVAQGILANESVHVLVAPYTSSASMAVVAAVNATDLPVMVWGGASESIFTQATRAPNVFGFLTPAGSYMYTGLDSLHDRGASTVLLVKDDQAFSVSVCDGAKAYAEGLGFSVVGEVSVQSNGDDVQTLLTNLSADQKSPDVLVGCGHSDAMMELVMHEGDAGVSAHAVLATQVGTSSFISALESAGDVELACGLLMPTQWVSSGDKTDAVVGWTATQFVEEFTVRAGSPPTYHSASAAAVGVAISNALATGQRARHWPVASVPAENLDDEPSGFVNELKNLDIDSFYGKLSFDATGQNTAKGMYTVQNHADGTNSAIAPEDAKEAELVYPGSCSGGGQVASSAPRLARGARAPPLLLGRALLAAIAGAGAGADLI